MNETTDNFCCQRVPPGGPFCPNHPTHDVATNYGFLGSVCDEHWAMVVAILGPPEKDRVAA